MEDTSILPKEVATMLRTPRAYAPEATSYVVIVPVLMIVIPPIHRFAMGQAGLPARYCIAPIRLFNVT